MMDFADRFSIATGRRLWRHPIPLWGADGGIAGAIRPERHSCQKENRRAVSDCRAAAGWYGLDQFQTEGECMTTSVDLRLLAVDALKDATTAGANVYSPRDLATWDGDYPMLVVTAPQEDGQGLGRIGAPQFNVTTTLRVLGRVQRAAEEDDLAAAKLYEDLEALRDQVKRAIINHPTIMGCYSSIHSSGQRSMRPPVRTLVFIKVKWLSILAWSFSKGPMSSIRSPYRGCRWSRRRSPCPRELSSRAQQSIFPSRRTSCLSNLRRGC